MVAAAIETDLAALSAWAQRMQAGRDLAALAAAIEVPSGRAGLVCGLSRRLRRRSRTQSGGQLDGGLAWAGCIPLTAPKRSPELLLQAISDLYARRLDR